MEELTQAAQLEERPNVGEGGTERGFLGLGRVKGRTHLLQTMEMATRDTTNTTPAAAEPAIRGSCSLSSDL